MPLEPGVDEQERRVLVLEQESSRVLVHVPILKIKKFFAEHQVIEVL